MASPRNIRFSIKKKIWAMPCAVCGCVGFTDVDHIIPVSKGGGSEESNLQPLCWQCNKKKCDRLTNEQLRAWFESRKEEHLERHAYHCETWRMNPFDKPSIAEWREKKRRKLLEALDG